MFDWLFEGRTSVYVVLAASTAFLLLVWWQMRKRRWLIAAAFAAASIGLYAILDVAVETDREQIVRKVQTMIAAINAHDIDAAFVHLSDQFHSPAGKSKEELRGTAQLYLNQGIVKHIKVWDIVCEGTPYAQQQTARVYFSVKVEGFRDLLADCEGTFDFDPEHGWRLKSVRLFKPQSKEEWPIQF